MFEIVSPVEWEDCTMAWQRKERTRQRLVDECLANGAVIHWSRRTSEHVARAHVPISYPCCGCTVLRERAAARRLRVAPIARCHACAIRARGQGEPRPRLEDGVVACVRCRTRPARLVLSPRRGRPRHAHLCAECYASRYNKQAYYRMLRESTPACPRCGFVPVVLRQLEVHHKDGDRSNHDPANLEVLCANCHAYETAMQCGEVLLRRTP
jgi:hypothetical protein